MASPGRTVAPVRTIAMTPASRTRRPEASRSRTACMRVAGRVGERKRRFGHTGGPLATIRG